jgi:hypothetical protein
MQKRPSKKGEKFLKHSKSANYKNLIIEQILGLNCFEICLHEKASISIFFRTASSL